MSSYTIPMVTETTPRGDRYTDLYSRLLGERIILLGTPIDDGVANVIVAQLLHLAAVDPDREIQLYINSTGGSFASLMAIYDTMQFVSPPVATLCVGHAASTAAILLAAGAHGHRAVLEHSRVLLHQPHAPGRQGSLSDLALEAAELARIRDEADTVLARHTGHTVAQVRVDTERAMVLSGAAVVDYGIVDVVLTPAGSGSQQLSPQAALHPDA